MHKSKRLIMMGSTRYTSLELSHSYPNISLVAYGSSNDGNDYLYGYEIYPADATHGSKTRVIKCLVGSDEYSAGGNVASVVTNGTIHAVYTTSVDDLIFAVVYNSSTLNFYLLRSTDGGATWANVFTFGGGNGIAGADTTNVQVLRSGASFIELTRNLPGGTGLGDLYLGEYNINTSRTAGSTNDRVRLMKSTDQGATWTAAVTWNTDGSNTNTTHIHNIKQDQYTGYLYIMFGDGDTTSAIVRWDGVTAWSDNTNFADLAVVENFSVVTGSQRFRAVDLLFTEDYMFNFADSADPIAQTENGIWRHTKDLSSETRVNNSISSYDVQHTGWGGAIIGDTLLFTTSRSVGWTKEDIQIYTSRNSGDSWQVVGEQQLDATYTGSLSPEFPLVVGNKVYINNVYGSGYISTDSYEIVNKSSYKTFHPNSSVSSSSAQLTYKVTVTDGQATTPTFTFYAATRAPSAQVDWGDETEYSDVTSGVQLTHTYTTGGTYLVKLIMPYQQYWLRDVNIASCKAVGSEFIESLPALTSISNITCGTNALTGTLTDLPRRTVTIDMQSNATLNQSITDWTLPSLLRSLDLHSSGYTGSVASWILPASLQYLAINGLSITGDISTWIIPAALKSFFIQYTGITACPDLSSMVNIEYLKPENCSLIQATVDLYLSRCVARMASVVYEFPTVRLGGTNAIPSAAGLANKDTLTAAGWTVYVSEA